MGTTFKSVEFVRAYRVAWVTRMPGDKAVLADWYADVLASQGVVKALAVVPPPSQTGYARAQRMFKTPSLRDRAQL